MFQGTIIFIFTMTPGMRTWGRYLESKSQKTRFLLTCVHLSHPCWWLWHWLESQATDSEMSHRCKQPEWVWVCFSETVWVNSESAYPYFFMALLFSKTSWGQEQGIINVFHFHQVGEGWEWHSCPLIIIGWRMASLIFYLDGDQKEDPKGVLALVFAGEAGVGDGRQGIWEKANL